MIPISIACINLIKKFEGLELKPYHGAADPPGVFTIGYGTTHYPPNYLHGKPVALSDPAITEEQAGQFLKYWVTQKARAIELMLRQYLSSSQYGALISFVYNLGEQAFEKSTLCTKVNANPQDQSIRDELMKWVHANGKVQPGLVLRRKAEVELYFSSES